MSFKKIGRCPITGQDVSIFYSSKEVYTIIRADYSLFSGSSTYKIGFRKPLDMNHYFGWTICENNNIHMHNGIYIVVCLYDPSYIMRVWRGFLRSFEKPNWLREGF